ncbi:MAG: 4Fe-4S dicluster domain-containing protein [Desulfobacter sp.]
METRRQFIKNGLFICMGTGAILGVAPKTAFPASGEKQWGMVIDSKRCSGCQACMVACKLQSATAPDCFNTRIREAEMGTYPDTGLAFFADLCRHCARPACVDACPSGAAAVHPSGLVMTDWGRCNGCGECIDACPFQARFSDPRFSNRADKCDLCIYRITRGMAPACVENCASGARIFGRLDTPQGEFARYLGTISHKARKESAVFIIAPETEENLS